MNIGIILYSQTGNTRYAGETLKEKLAAKGHTAVLDEITIAGDAASVAGPVVLKNEPNAAGYDAVVLAAPVQAFSLCKPMKAYLQKLGGVSGKKAACFVTKQLGGAWTGGTGAVRTMKKALEAEGARCEGSEIIFWSAQDREQRIDAAMERLAGLF